MKCHKYNVGDSVVITPLALSGLPSNIGSKVTIVEQLTSGNYDYRVQFEDHSFTKVKEIELIKLEPDDDILKLKVGDYYKINNNTVKVVKIDYLYRQVEIEYVEDNGVMEVVDVINLIEKVDDEMENEFTEPKHIAEELIDTFLSQYRNSDNTYTIPEQLLLKLIGNLYWEVE